MPTKRIVIVGNGQMAITCLRILQLRSDVAVVLVITDPKVLSIGSSLAEFCRTQQITCLTTGEINSTDVVNTLREAQPDFIFNINSYRIIKDGILSLPGVKIINFHNAPLPRYGGVNICSWAIINQEKTHGVTWHLVDKGVDTGDIIGQRFFEIAADDTAITLTLKCIAHGIELFEEIVPEVIAGRVNARKQDSSLATYYSLKDIPNGGLVDFNWTFGRLDSFVRGLTFHPMPNSFVYPETSYDGRRFYIQQVSRVREISEPGICGKVIGISKEQIEVQIKDCIVGIEQVLDDEKEYIRVQDLVDTYEIKEGVMLGGDRVAKGMLEVDGLSCYG